VYVSKLNLMSLMKPIAALRVSMPPALQTDSHLELWIKKKMARLTHAAALPRARTRRTRRPIYPAKENWMACQV
jgi:hypothetical protein